MVYTKIMRGRGTQQAHCATNGSKWIRPAKRLAIYLRDGLACSWCGEGLERGAQLTLDHVVPHSRGGSNEAANLVTACRRGNSSRGTRSVPEFAGAVSAYIGGTETAEIVRHVRNARRRALAPHLDEAKRVIARRGGYGAAVASLGERR